MNILIISDSHGRTDLVEEAILRTCPDTILFAGDGLWDLSQVALPCPTYAVRGNGDWFSSPFPFANGQAEDEAIFDIEHKKILLVHGHKWGVKSGMSSVVARAAQVKADILIFGHTHQPAEWYLTPNGPNDISGGSLKTPLWVFNPGSLGERPHTFGTLTLHNGIPLFGHGEI